MLTGLQEVAGSSVLSNMRDRINLKKGCRGTRYSTVDPRGAFILVEAIPFSGSHCMF